MDREDPAKAELNDPGLECEDYAPIAAVANPAPEYGGAESEANGCDSCLNWRDGRCALYGGDRWE